MHSMCSEPLGEIQLEYHIEVMMEEDEQPPLGSSIDEKQIDV